MSQVHLALPIPCSGSHRMDFFLGAWSPSGRLKVSHNLPAEARFLRHAGPNWFLISEVSPFHDPARGLVHAGDLNTGDLAAAAFRGYLLDPPVYSWGEPAAILRYWANPPQTHNGIFAAARVLQRGRQLELITDLFGIAPLYYRIWNGVVLFSSIARLLELEGDRMDLVMGRALLELGSVFGNRTLTSGIHRVPPAHRLSFERAAPPVAEKWFHYSDFPSGDMPITPAAVQQVEESFQNAVDRCLRLPVSNRILPLSSGYDSRRILAAFNSRQTPFHAVTVRILQKQNRDLDGYWTSVMAKDFGFSHEVVELPDPIGYAEDDRLSRCLTGTEFIETAWILSLTRVLPQRESLVFDGLGGDIFNNTGYAIPEMYTCAESEKLRLLANHHIPPRHFAGVLNDRFWPGVDQVHDYMADYLADLPEGKNRSDYAFLLVRARHGTGVWSQTMVPAGHLTVHPYFDFDYARVTLQYDPLHKIERFFQHRCLSEFWPQYYAYPGSRRIPPDCEPGSPAQWRNNRLASLRRLFREVGAGRQFRDLREWLTARGYAQLLVSAHSDAMASRSFWWLYPILSLKARNLEESACWSIPTAVGPVLGDPELKGIAG